MGRHPYVYVAQHRAHSVLICETELCSFVRIISRHMEPQLQFNFVINVMVIPVSSNFCVSQVLRPTA